MESLRVGLSVLVFGGLLSPRGHVLEKEMKFAKWALVTQGAGIVSMA